MVGINKAFRAALIAAAGLALSLVLTTCEPLALRDLAEKLAQGGAKHLYITDRDAGKIYRCELDGSNLVEIEPLSGRGSPAMIAVDPDAGRLFWTSAPAGGYWEVLSADLNGSDVFVLFKEASTTPERGPRGVSPKSSTSSLYWSGIYTNLIYEQEYTSTTATPLNHPLVAFTYDVYYSSALDRIFVANPAEGRIHRIRTDGTHEATLELTDIGTSTPINVTVDGVLDHVYWSDDDGNEFTSNSGIYRCDADLAPASVETVIASAGSPRQLVVDPEEGFLFWADDTADSIKRANLDGTDVRTIVSGLQNPRGVALDPVRR